MQKIFRQIFLSGILLVAIFGFAVYHNLIDVNYRSICISVLGEKKNSSVAVIEINKLVKLTRHIIKAHRYSRSGKTKLELLEAFNIAQEILDKSYGDIINDTLSLENSDKPLGTSETVANVSEICPEVYMGMTFGYPYYYTGFKTDYDNCTGKPLGSLVTVLVNMVNDVTAENFKSILNGLRIYYPGVRVVVGHNSSDNISSFLKSVPFNFVTFSDNVPAGQVWSELAQNADTPYLFVARQMMGFDNHTSLERLLRFLSHGIAAVVGTSHRFADGKWFRGCYAMAMRNYTIRFVDGYDISFNSCLYCDYVSGPFVISKETLVNVIDKEMNNETVFVDMFTKLSIESKTVLTCPDVMVTISDNQMQNVPKASWLPFVQKWELNKIIFSNSRHLNFDCSESKTKCERVAGQIMPICCLQELVDLMKVISKLCEENGIDIELDAGTDLGAAKLYGVLPYERDADFDLMSTHYKKFRALKSKFKEAGYRLSEDENDYKCLGNMSLINCGYFAVRSDNWRIEMWGANWLGSDEAFRVGLKTRTKVMVDGMWMVAQHSPAGFARNKYGDDLYQHVEHWGTLGYKTSWVQPKTGRWLPCSNPGFHGCLDLYLPVGDIQFQDVWI